MSKQTKVELMGELTAIKKEHAACPTIKVPTVYQEYVTEMARVAALQPIFEKDNISGSVTAGGALAISARVGAYSMEHVFINKETTAAFLQWCEELRGGEPQKVLIREVTTEITDPMSYWFGVLVGLLLGAVAGGLLGWVVA